MAKARVAMSYDAPGAYAKLIAPRYLPIAKALLAQVALKPRDDVLELGAGTGLVTKLVAPHVRSLLATDLTPGMLDLARRSTRTFDGMGFALVDYGAPLPFLDASFDLVLSGLTYVQDSPEALREVARVLRRRGRVAFSMWGPAYDELTLLSDALVAIGRPPIPPPSPARAMQRLRRAGFTSVIRHDVDLTNRFRTVDEYIAYRRGFGIPAGAQRRLYERLLRSVRTQAERYADADGRLAIGWTISVLTARKP